MTAASVLTSVSNPRVKQVVRLRDRRHREQEGLMIIEGYRELSRALDAGLPLACVFFCAELFLGGNEDSLLARVRAAGVECQATGAPVFARMAYRDRPEGLLALAPIPPRPLPASLCGAARPAAGAAVTAGGPPLVLVAEGLEKPGNLGTLLRSADAAGVDLVIVCDRTTDLANPNVVRASVGTLFTVPVAEAEGDETLAWLRAQGLSIVAATPEAPTCYTEADLAGPLAVVLGREQYGLSPRWRTGADLQVRIPMAGRADSLNVAQAGTLLLFEARRQRGG